MNRPDNKWLTLPAPPSWFLKKSLVFELTDSGLDSSTTELVCAQKVIQWLQWGDGFALKQLGVGSALSEDVDLGMSQ